MQKGESFEDHAAKKEGGTLTVTLTVRQSIIAAVLLCSSAAGAADNIGVAKQVIRKLYPELQGKGLPVIVRDGSTLDGTRVGGDFILDVLKPGNPHIADNSCHEQLISVRLEFPVGGQDRRLFALSAGGPVVNSDLQRQLREAVDGHPEWSEADLTQALERAGAQFGPAAKEGFVGALPMEALRLLLGDVRVMSVNFRFRDEVQQHENLPAATLLWTVQLTVHLRDRQILNYYALFEPFQGKLVSLGRTPPIP
jgi:hypothetical protein